MTPPHIPDPTPPAGGTQRERIAKMRAELRAQIDIDCGKEPPAADPAVEAVTEIQSKHPQSYLNHFRLSAAAIIRRHYAPLLAAKDGEIAQLQVIIKASNERLAALGCGQDENGNWINKERDALKAQVEMMEKDHFAGCVFKAGEPLAYELLAKEITDLRAQLERLEKEAAEHAEDWALLGLRPGSIQEQIVILSDSKRKTDQQLATATAELAQERARLDWLLKNHCMTYHSENTFSGGKSWTTPYADRGNIDAARKQEDRK